jgi:uncharacterized protein
MAQYCQNIIDQIKTIPMNDALSQAQAFIDKLKINGLSITTASVFGSWAKGTATKDSDIDVCIVSPRFGIDIIQEMVDLRKIALSVDSRIEPIPFSPEDYQDPLSSLASEIRKHAITLQ